ncbi:MAG: hypothetical protein FWG53_04825 [Clostridiales bacterium]|nr:hypothetical protein [Clostridiales bacterium]
MVFQKFMVSKWTKITLVVMLAVLIAAASSVGTYFFLHNNNSVEENNKTAEICREPVWKELYATELRQHIGADSPMFNIYDLDGDGVPELLFSDNDAHFASGEIFTVYQGKLKKLGNYGSWGEFQYNSENKYIFGGMTGQGCNYTSVYKIENGKTIELVSFYDNSGCGGDFELVFTVNGKEVSKEDFDAETAKYGTDDSPTPFVRKYDVTEREIVRVLGYNPREGFFEEQEPLVETFNIEKSPMTHNGTFAFSWTTDKVFGARTLDYLTPQIPEIFETLGIETISQYVVEDDTAKYVTFWSMLRCYNIIDKNMGDGIAVLCYVKKSRDTVDVSVQVINPSIIVFPASHDGQNDFGFADFDGDGKDEVYVTSLDIGADNYHITLGIFPFDSDNGNWGAPMFWASCGGDDTERNNGILPFNSGFIVEGKNKSYTIKNKLTGYSRKLPYDDFCDYDDWALNYALITSVTVVDVDGDGVFELIIEQHPFHWMGECVSLLKYNTAKKSFETIYAEFALFDDPEDNGYQRFLKNAGYDAGKAIFK